MRAGDAKRNILTRTILPWAVMALLTVAAILSILYATGVLASQSRQEEAPQQEARQQEVAERGAEVMPFDLDRTTHVFEPSESGGVERVTADDPADDRQISLIREHLREEADKFSRSDFSDPAEIHGEDMPGLKELEAGASRIEFRYSELADGAQIEDLTQEPALVSALHEWFEAQLSDHGAHASPGGDHSSRH